MNEKYSNSVIRQGKPGEDNIILLRYCFMRCVISNGMVLSFFRLMMREGNKLLGIDPFRVKKQQLHPLMVASCPEGSLLSPGHKA